MRRTFRASGIALVALAGCVELPPEHVAVLPQAETVEVVTEVPNPDVYEPYGLVTGQATGSGNDEATANARNALRNKAAALKATFVGVEEVSAIAAWDFSGKTVVTIKGHVYRPKE